jgi:hypothetical protein
MAYNIALEGKFGERIKRNIFKNKEGESNGFSE